MALIVSGDLEIVPSGCWDLNFNAHSNQLSYVVVNYTGEDFLPGDILFCIILSTLLLNISCNENHLNYYFNKKYMQKNGG